MIRRVLLTIVLLLVGITMLPATPAHAASVVINSVYLDGAPYWSVNFTYTGTTDDNGVGTDYFLFACYNASGQLADVDQFTAFIGSTFTGTDTCNDGNPLPGINTPIARIEVYDVNANSPYTTNSQASVDWAKGFPLITVWPSRAGCPIFFDGRLNSCDAGQTVAVYCDRGTVTGLAIYKGVGYPGIVATAAEIAKVPTHPAKNTLIKQGNGIRLYRLTSGLLQVNRREDGSVAKEYSYKFTCSAVSPTTD